MQALGSSHGDNATDRDTIGIFSDRIEQTGSKDIRG